MGHTTSQQEVVDIFKKRIKELKNSRVYKNNKNWFNTKICDFMSEIDEVQKSSKYFASLNLIDNYEELKDKNIDDIKKIYKKFIDDRENYYKEQNKILKTLQRLSSKGFKM